jgi:hypothetical protein
MGDVPENVARTARAVASFVRHCPDIDAAERQIAQALMGERERCAMIADWFFGSGDWMDRDHAGRAIAAAILKGEQP